MSKTSSKFCLLNIVVFICLFCVGLYGIELTQGIIVDADHPKAYGMNFSVLLPDKWNIIDSGKPNVLKEAHTKQWQFTINVCDLSVLIDDLELAEDAKQELMKMTEEKMMDYLGSSNFLQDFTSKQVGMSRSGVGIKGVQIKTSEKLRIDSLPALLIQANYTIGNNQKNASISAFFCIVYNDARFLVLNYAILPSEQDAKNKERKINVLSFEDFKEISQSVVVLNKRPREDNHDIAEHTEKTEGDTDEQSKTDDDSDVEATDWSEKIDGIMETMQSPMCLGILAVILAVGVFVVIKQRKNR